MDDEDDLNDPKSDDLYALFGALREHVVDVVDDFADRVSATIDTLAHAERFESPSILRVLISSMMQTINIATDRDKPEEPDDEHR